MGFSKAGPTLIRRIVVCLGTCRIIACLGTFVIASLVLGAGWGNLPVKEIEIQGNRKIERGAVLHKVHTRTGEALDPQKLDEDIKAIYDIGYFEDIKVDVKEIEGGLLVTYLVTERPLIKKITFSGNKKIKTETLQEKIDLTTGSIFNPYLVKRNIQNLTQFYKDEGYYLARIDYRAEKISEEQIELIFDINEGRKIKIRKVVIEGNKSYSDRQIKKIITTKKHGFFSFITSSGYLKKENLSQDVQRLEDFYFNQGLIHAGIQEPKISFDQQKSALTVTFQISEGDQYRVGKVIVKGNEVISTSEIKTQTHEGEVFNRAKLRQDISAIQDLYANRGYLFTRVTPITHELPEEKKIDITFEIEEGGLTYVDRIRILGNIKTRDKVIRREVKVKEGDIFSSQKMRRSYNDITNLGFFEEVNLDIQPKPEKEKVDLLIKVKERMTSQISMGGGYSSVDQLVGTAEIKSGNLFGLGEQLSLSAELSSKRSTYDLGFTEPWLFDIPLSAGFDIYYMDKEYDNYTKTARGGDLRFGYPVADYTRLFGTYLYEKIHVKVDDPNSTLNEKKEIVNYDPNNPATTRVGDDRSTTSSIRLSLVRDSRDNRIKPTRGSLNKISFQVAGSVLGGTNYFTKTIVDSGWHFPVWKQLVLSFHAKAGYASGYGERTLPVFERFYAGGLDTVRGHRDNSIGPRYPDGDPKGGDKLVVTNVEFQFPIYDIIRGVLFWDTGNVFEEGQEFFDQPLRMGAGVGVRFFTPVGPLRLDWGYILNRRKGNRMEEDRYAPFSFSIGTYF